MENFQSDLYGRTGTVQVKSGMSIDSHLERCLLVQTAELYSPGSMLHWNLSFLHSYYSYDSHGKTQSDLSAVKILYRSGLYVPLIPILKGAVWTKRQSCTVLRSMLTGI